MTYCHYERLSAMDAVFLDIEGHNSHMHIGSVGIFDAGPLTMETGGLDIDRILDFCEVALDKNPRFRQKLAYVPGLGNPVWIDDDSFKLTYHIRHVRLPAPGDERLLKRLAGRVMSQQLDRGKPLWEFWYVEGVADDRFAVISKIHHCLADGVSGVDLLSSLMGPDPDYKPPHFQPGERRRWFPRPAPSAERLLADEISHRIRAPFELLRPAQKKSSGKTTTTESISGLLDMVKRAGEAFGSGLSPASETPFDANLGPHRRFDWAKVDMARMREVKDRVGGKINDVALTVVSGALRRFLKHRNVDVAELDFRVMVPVSMRNSDESGKLGNRVSLLLAQLPLGIKDPVERLRRIAKITRELKASHQVDATDFIMRFTDAIIPGLTSQLTRLGMQTHAANLVVTNVPGPPAPVYFLGSRLLANYPVVPLAANQALGVALLSYDGILYWGFNSDWDVLPDLHDLALAVQEEFELLYAAASAAPAPSAIRRKKRPRKRGKGRAAGKHAHRRQAAVAETTGTS
jgi:diacylglycerol O-acyltransferase